MRNKLNKNTIKKFDNLYLEIVHLQAKASLSEKDEDDLCAISGHITKFLNRRGIETPLF